MCRAGRTTTRYLCGRWHDKKNDLLATEKNIATESSNSRAAEYVKDKLEFTSSADDTCDSLCRAGRTTMHYLCGRWHDEENDLLRYIL